MSKTVLGHLNDEAALKEIEKKQALLDEFVRKGFTTLKECSDYLKDQASEIKKGSE
jgi:hypothetical protein